MAPHLFVNVVNTDGIDLEWLLGKLPIILGKEASMPPWGWVRREEIEMASQLCLPLSRLFLLSAFAFASAKISFVGLLGLPVSWCGHEADAMVGVIERV